jgi:hypothetical protein
MEFLLVLRGNEFVRRVRIESVPMSLPLQPPDSLPRRAPALRLVPGPSLDLGPEGVEAEIRAVGEVLENLETFDRDIRTSFEELRSSVDSTPGGEVDCDHLEAAAEALEDLERSLAAKWAEIQDRCERTVVRARNLIPSEPLWSRYADVLDRAIEAAIRLLQTLRDSRLELAVILTEADCDIDSPVFDDPEELKKYLESI